MIEVPVGYVHVVGIEDVWFEDRRGRVPPSRPIGRFVQPGGDHEGLAASLDIQKGVAKDGKLHRCRSFVRDLPSPIASARSLTARRSILYAMWSTPAPRNSSCLSICSARFACSNSNGTVDVWIGISPAILRNSSPSARVFAVTLRSSRS